MKTSHPATRFIAPKSIPRGTAFADVINRQAVELLAESIEAVFPEFDTGPFIRVRCVVWANLD